MADYEKLEATLEETQKAVKEHHETWAVSPIPILKHKIRQLHADAQVILTEGAEDCPECGEHPIGIQQPAYYEIRCLSKTCPERHAKDRVIELAVKNCNAEDYFSRNGQVLTVSKA